ncbi:hypothetical protein JIG36_25600 [Actinoplanes sp. LDG1-06]|uniref:Helix-turn-helix domain-containing protein n=1 Tax=Paractinoplanes ovalisporus TaxID=2810368 RepID=A0ABS2AGJ0_9ACTN|nr:hypothetical protein [Actinoplanes ovalisporus]MBM2618939.1 hypothetical protein [Actinoplanes ovalisporus]
MSATATPTDRSSAASVALQRFALDLQEARRADGEPTYATLVHRMNHEFSKATISRVLNGGRPSWDFTYRFLKACRVPDATITETWRPKWTHLWDALRPLDLQHPPDATDNTGAECTVCGAWVMNRSRHAAYHQQRDDLSTSSSNALERLDLFDGKRG